MAQGREHPEIQRKVQQLGHEVAVWAGGLELALTQTVWNSCNELCTLEPLRACCCVDPWQLGVSLYSVSSDLHSCITSACWNVALLLLGQILLSITQALMQGKGNRDMLIFSSLALHAWALVLLSDTPAGKGPQSYACMVMPHTTGDLSFSVSLLSYQHYIWLDIIQSH